MIRIGIVGDIGSGKSYLQDNLDIPVFNADLEVAKLYKKTENVISNLKKYYQILLLIFLSKKNDILKAIHRTKKI